MRFVVRRVVVLGIARGRLNIRFGHCTSCLFDNSSVKLCKHDTPLLFAPSGANHEQGLWWDRVCEAQRSNESPSGAFKRQRGLRQQMEGRCPDKFYNCFRIVKTQKISRGDSAHVRGSPFAPNEVPAPVCAAALTESRYHVRSAHEIFKVRFPQKENTAHAAQR